jgi:hypothetical protein
MTANQAALCSQLREGILQDILAMGMIAAALQQQLEADEQSQTAQVLRFLSMQLAEDAEQLRSLIAGIDAA